MFDVTFGNSIASAGQTFPDFSPSPCGTRVQTPSLAIDTTQGSCDWSQASSPYCNSPVTPQFPIDPSSFDAMCAEGDNLFTPGSFSFNNSYPLPCRGGFPDAFNTFGHPDTYDPSSFSNEDFFSKNQFSLFEPGKLELASVDMEFSAFMSSLSAF